jgi:hypothetical protein
VVIDVHVQREAHLAEIVHTLDSFGFSLRSRQRRQEQRRQNRNDGDDDQQFDQGESFCATGFSPLEVEVHGMPRKVRQNGCHRQSRIRCPASTP